MAMGLRFAGSCNEQAFDVLQNYCTLMIALTDSSIAELAGKSTIETCLNVVICSLAMVKSITHFHKKMKNKTKHQFCVTKASFDSKL